MMYGIIPFIKKVIARRTNIQQIIHSMKTLTSLTALMSDDDFKKILSQSKTIKIQQIT